MTYTYIDIHTHVNLSAFDGDWREVIAHVRDEGVAHINVGTQIDTSRRAVEIAETYEDGVYAIIGIHPVHTNKSYHDEQELGKEYADGKGFTSRGEQFDAAIYRDLAASDKVVAIGECGFDYYHSDEIVRENQEAAFIAQIELANELNKPLMLHVRASEGSMDAYEDALSIVKQYAKVRGNVHFFVGTLEIAKQFWDIGFTTSFTGVITFTHDYDEVVKNAPLEWLHGETDAPYVAPVPFRGKRNEPMHVKEVYKKIAEIRGEDEEAVRAQLIQNAEKLFSISL